MKALDLFSGLRGWSAPWAAAGHETFAIDNSPAFEADSHLDIGDVGAVLAALPWKPDVILASPPCTAFSTMTMGRNWTHAGEPRTESARQGQRLVLATIRIIAATSPQAWVIENPRARLRTLGLLDGLERRTVTYCQLGEDRMKPTDLWIGGDFAGISLPAICKNGAPCHIAAPRGSRTGTQGGVSSAEAGKIPFLLTELFRKHLEAAP